MSGKSVPARRSDLSPALGVLSFLHPGVLTGDETMELFRYAQKHGFAIPAVNCTNSDTVNSCLEAAAAVKSPIIIQFSNGGAAFVSGKGLKTDREQGNAIMGSVVGAKYVHSVAAAYGVPVVLHTDHCAKKLLPWLDTPAATSQSPSFRRMPRTPTASRPMQRTSLSWNRMAMPS